MKLLGFDLKVTRTGTSVARTVPTTEKARSLSSVGETDRGWFRIFESFSGAWQRNITVDFDAVLTNHAVFACITLIASDVAKMRVKLVEQDSDGIWNEIESSSFSPVLRKPNKMQNRIQFFESWMLSKLIRGNTYVLLQRDNRGVVTRMWVLDPTRVTPLVTEDGDVYYRLATDNIVGLAAETIVPAREIIHDRFNCMFHPLVGLSPIYACGLAAMQSLAISQQSTKLFENNARPGGILTAPTEISPEAAKELKEEWEKAFSGDNAGKVAVLGDGLTYQNLALTSVETQLIEQSKWTATVICSTFHVPPYKVNVGEMPKYNNIQALNVEYYSQSLQRLIEDAELCLDEGLGLGRMNDGRILGTEFDLDNLLRMDSETFMKVQETGVGAGILAPDEARFKLNYGPKPGGDTPYLQQQNYSLGALAKRDATDDPFASATSSSSKPAAAAASGDDAPANDNAEADQREARSLQRRAMLSASLGLASIPLKKSE